jgi:hypothetical protein
METRGWVGGVRSRDFSARLFGDEVLPRRLLGDAQGGDDLFLERDRLRAAQADAADQVAIGAVATRIGRNPKSYIASHRYPLPYHTHDEDKEAPAYTDCGTFVGTCVRPVDPYFPPNSTSVQADYMRSHPDRWQVATGPPQPGDIAVRTRRDDNEVGHIIVRGSDGQWYDASLGDHGPRLRRGGPYRSKRYRYVGNTGILGFLQDERY